MKTLLAITDLTRMQRGCVCVAGYDKDGRCFRPTLPPPGIKETSLFTDGRAIVFPFAVVEYDLVLSRPQPPHTEDYDYDPASVKFIRRVKDDRRERLLKLSLFESVAAIFEQPIHDDMGFYVMDGRGPRSIGTILPKQIHGVRYAQDQNRKWDYRVRFADNLGQTYRLKITDLTWHCFCDSRRDKEHQPEQMAVELSEMLQARRVYLRIGLSRGWAEHPGQCFLQVNAIHTFPDYLEGKNFADFRPRTTRVPVPARGPQKPDSAEGPALRERRRAYSVGGARQRFAKANRRWSPEDEKRLKEQYAAGLSVPELAKSLQRKEGAIQSRLRKLGLVE